MVVSITLLFSLIPVALIRMAWLKWRQLPKTIAEQKPLRSRAATVALAAASIQAFTFIGFGVYGQVIGGFSRNYEAFYTWGRVNLLLLAITLTGMAVGTGTFRFLAGSASVILSVSWFLLSFGQ